MKPGDKCPRCHNGLIVRTELGLTCEECSWEEDIERVVEKQEKRKTVVGDYKFRPKKFAITIDDAEDAEEFLRGLIVARSNNSSEYFVEMIEAVNSILEPYRAARLKEELADRASAGMA